MTRTTAVLLAADAGTRLGLEPQALLPFRGTTLVAHMAGELLRGGCAEVVLVMGAGVEEVRTTSLPAGCRVIFNPHGAEGMGSSFALGWPAPQTDPCWWRSWTSRVCTLASLKSCSHSIVPERSRPPGTAAVAGWQAWAGWAAALCVANIRSCFPPSMLLAPPQWLRVM